MSALFVISIVYLGTAATAGVPTEQVGREVAVREQKDVVSEMVGPFSAPLRQS
jgi:hypothetical protein